jgi:hypothetical protein
MSSTSPVDTFKGFGRNDQIVLGTGVLAFILSFFPYWGGSASGATIAGQHIGGASSSVTAWHSYSTIALLLILIGTALTAFLLFARDSVPNLAIGPRWIAAGVCALGALLYVIRLFTLPSDSQSFDGFKYSYGVKWGGYVLLVVVVVNAAFAIMNALSSDETKPWEAGGINTGGAASAPFSTPAAPAPEAPAAPEPPAATEPPAAPTA